MSNRRRLRRSCKPPGQDAYTLAMPIGQTLLGLGQRRNPDGSHLADQGVAEVMAAVVLDVARQRRLAIASCTVPQVLQLAEQLAAAWQVAGDRAADVVLVGTDLVGDPRLVEANLAGLLRDLGHGVLLLTMPVAS